MFIIDSTAQDHKLAYSYIYEPIMNRLVSAYEEYDTNIEGNFSTALSKVDQFIEDILVQQQSPDDLKLD